MSEETKQKTITSARGSVDSVRFDITLEDGVPTHIQREAGGRFTAGKFDENYDGDLLASAFEPTPEVKVAILLGRDLEDMVEMIKSLKRENYRLSQRLKKIHGEK